LKFLSTNYNNKIRKSRGQ